MSRLGKLVRTVRRLEADYDVACTNLARARADLVAARHRRRDVKLAQAIVQAAAQAVQERVHRRMAGVVSRCLTAVYGDAGYEFRFVFERKRGRTEARPAFYRGGHEFDPLGGAGSGMVDVATFALRMCKVMLQRPPVARVLWLDEPFTKPSRIRGYRERVRDMLETVCEELDFQIILVTHDPDLACGKVVRLGD